ncbi:DNA-directed RNA polymerase subunit omega [bacterium]|jgi:DNA-directed RNA polymerase subunit omega|nr:DNA-directed RNA polymerase subunit omega [bacterium]
METKKQQDKLTISDITDKIPNRFLLTVAAAKRARQLKEGARPLIETNEEDTTMIITALKEFQQEKLSLQFENHKSENEVLLDEINDLIDTDILVEEPTDEQNKDASSKKETKSKKKSLSA